MGTPAKLLAGLLSVAALAAAHSATADARSGYRCVGSVETVRKSEGFSCLTGVSEVYDSKRRSISGWYNGSERSWIAAEAYKSTSLQGFYVEDLRRDGISPRLQVRRRNGEVSEYRDDTAGDASDRFISLRGMTAFRLLNRNREGNVNRATKWYSVPSN